MDTQTVEKKLANYGQTNMLWTLPRLTEIKKIYISWQKEMPSVVGFHLLFIYTSNSQFRI